jgi:hypothetical protein
MKKIFALPDNHSDGLDVVIHDAGAPPSCFAFQPNLLSTKQTIFELDGEQPLSVEMPECK